MRAPSSIQVTAKKTYAVKAGVLINALENVPHPPLGSVEIDIDIAGSAKDIYTRVSEWWERYDTIEKIKDGCIKRAFPTIICETLIERLKNIGEYNTNLNGST